MRYIPVTCEQRDEMLRAVGATRVSELFDSIPPEVRLEGGLDLPEGLTEQQLVEHLGVLASADDPATALVSFLGAGCYDHYVPSVVDHVLRKPELFTAYTPYQPEVSQGTLQAIYEFQSMICELTGMEVANASMYDGATAFVEAAYLASSQTRRSKLAVSASVHPEWLETLRTYAAAELLEVVVVPCAGGVTDVAAMAEAAVDAAAIMVTDPDFYGCLEDLGRLREIADSTGALLVVGTNPILLGVLEPAGCFGADIVVGEGQPLGSAMSYGGPGFGFFATRDAFLRRMPGRIVGRTTDVEGRTAFVLTMQTREQHIRREKATSNICSNHALGALAACVYLAAVGQNGLMGIGRSCIAKAHYLRERLLATEKFTAPWDHEFAHEFALRYEGDVGAMQDAMLEAGFLAGVDLGRFGEADAGLVLFAVTEKRSRCEMDAFAEEVSAL